MKATILKSIAITLFACVAVLACKDKDPAPDKTITMEDIATQYFIVQKNTGKPLGVIYFVNDGGTKFYYDVNSGRRVGTPVVSNVDAVKGSATLTIDLDSDGASMFVFDLLKANDGNLSLSRTTYQGVTSTVKSANVYKVSDLDGFSYPEFSFDKTANEKVYSSNFSATTWYYETGAVDAIRSVTSGEYYALQDNVGFKVESVPAFGVVFKKDSGKMGILLDNNGDVQEFQK